jgi:3-dehydroquinate dehydratase-1
MIKPGFLSPGDIPRIALVITDREANQAVKSLGVDALEARVDMFSSLEADYIAANIRRRRETGLPIILTVRNAAAEGGKSHISDEKKLEIFQSCTAWVDAVDIELSSPLLTPVIKLAKRYKRAAIVSSHNFQKTPPQGILEGILKKVFKKGADIAKIAAYANSQEDVRRLMFFTLKHREDRVITMSLGDIGAISRLAFPLAGSLLVYGYIDQPFAPGQIPLKKLQQDLRRYYPAYDKHLEKLSSHRPRSSVG